MSIEELEESMKWKKQFLHMLTKKYETGNQIRRSFMERWCYNIINIQSYKIEVEVEIDTNLAGVLLFLMVQEVGLCFFSPLYADVFSWVEAKDVSAVLELVDPLRMNWRKHSFCNFLFLLVDYNSQWFFMFSLSFFYIRLHFETKIIWYFIFLILLVVRNLDLRFLCCYFFDDGLFLFKAKIYSYLSERSTSWRFFFIFVPESQRYLSRLLIVEIISIFIHFFLLVSENFHVYNSCSSFLDLFGRSCLTHRADLVSFSFKVGIEKCIWSFCRIILNQRYGRILLDQRFSRCHMIIFHIFNQITKQSSIFLPIYTVRTFFTDSIADILLVKIWWAIRCTDKSPDTILMHHNRILFNEVGFVEVH